MGAPPKIAILGAGSVGCFIGAAWAIAGVPVAFFGRQRLAQDVQQHGLTISDYSGWKATLAPDEVEYHCGPHRLRDAELIVVTVKSGDTAAAAEEIARHAAPGATILSFQNGVSNVETLQQRLGGDFDVVRGVVPYNVAYLGEGRFHKGVAGELWAEDREQTRTLAAAVAPSVAALRLSDDMLALAWGKLLINLNNAVNALSGKTLRQELGCRDYRRVFAASMREGLRLLKQANIAPANAGPVPLNMLPRIIDSPDWLFNRLFLKRWKIDSRARSSMADDLASGRRTEVDYLNGELVRLANHLAQPAPVNRAILRLVNMAENGAEPLSPAALRMAVLGD